MAKRTKVWKRPKRTRQSRIDSAVSRASSGKRPPKNYKPKKKK